MQRTLVLDCINKIGEVVKIEGFIQTRRDHGKIIFLDILDRSGLIQVVISQQVESTSKESLSTTLETSKPFFEVSNLHAQDVVSITGKVQKRPENLVNKNISTGEIEIFAEQIEILSKAAELPFDMGGKELDLQLPTLLDFRSLTLRHPKVKDIFKVQAAILEGFRKVAADLDCTEIVVPEVAASSTEGGAEVFKVDYYGHKAFLTQSPQLYKQMLVPVFERVFTIAHAYRAEPSVTTRHLSVSTQIDCEFGFVEFEELLDLLEKVGTETLKYAENKCQEVFKNWNLEKIAFNKIPRLTLREAEEIIFKEFGRDSRKEKDLAPQDEIDICKWAKQKHDSDFVTITHFPTLKRAFYTKPDPKDSEYSLSYDLLLRGLEVMSGSLRINDYDELVNVIKDRGMDPKNFDLYLQAFKYGMPPEGGFSFGLERLTMHMLNLSNIREASLFPRDMERVDIRLNRS